MIAICLAQSKQHQVTDRTVEWPHRIRQYLARVMTWIIGVPALKWILPTPTSQPHPYHLPQELTWLDRQLCRLLFPLAQHSHPNIDEAMKYWRKQTKYYGRFLATLQFRHFAASVCFRKLPDGNLMAMSELEVKVHRKVVSLKLKAESSVCGCGFGYSSLTHVISVEMGIPTDFPHCHDCIIYVVDLSRPRTDDLKDILKLLSPHQHLIIAVIVDSRKGRCSRMEYLMQFFDNFGGFNNSPLACTATN
ncbi:unnamed protein product, partial [Hydatigera taeniaeformis]|uniref:DDE_Tnp_1_7 domain-containing protein n=1 Tax=Hydatigena taeniaeformis TaxID=6205 RepID=A0A0R3WPV0_HYDTA